MTSLPGFESFDDMDRWIDNFEANATRQLEVGQQMASRLSTIQGQGADDHRLAQATVDNNGALIGLTLQPRLRERDTATVAATIVTAVQRAQRNLGTQASKVLADHDPQDAQIAASMVQSYTERFGS